MSRLLIICEQLIDTVHTFPISVVCTFVVTASAVTGAYVAGRAVVCGASSVASEYAVYSAVVVPDVSAAKAVIVVCAAVVTLKSGILVQEAKANKREKVKKRAIIFFIFSPI
ncbi:MAG: hypothetical protein IJB45_05770 [Clostridia bacterium]|nr:hypothetical protein [Clostridia bacterium]